MQLSDFLSQPDQKLSSRNWKNAVRCDKYGSYGSWHRASFELILGSGGTASSRGIMLHKSSELLSTEPKLYPMTKTSLLLFRLSDFALLVLLAWVWILMLYSGRWTVPNATLIQLYNWHQWGLESALTKSNELATCLQARNQVRWDWTLSLKLTGLTITAPLKPV